MTKVRERLVLANQLTRRHDGYVLEQLPCGINKMDVNEKLLNNIVSYFSEKEITEEFKNLFLEELKKDEQFQEKLKGMLDLDEVTPGDEILWKKIIESDVNILSHEAREKLFKKFEQLLHEIFKSTESTGG